MRAGRMFEIIQLLRGAKDPVTAGDMAIALEVTKRTIYRDIAALQARRVPIEGEAGIGYVMRAGYDLPPVNFDVEEAEAITVGLSMIARTGDKSLERAARRAAQKLAEATELSDTVYASNWGPDVPDHVDMSVLRHAIRTERKLELVYVDVAGAQTRRVIRPVAVVYYSDAIVLAAWCELRDDFRHFRPDRFVALEVLDADFSGDGARLRKAWAETHLAEI